MCVKAAISKPESFAEKRTGGSGGRIYLYAYIRSNAAVGVQAKLLTLAVMSEWDVVQYYIADRL